MCKNVQNHFTLICFFCKLIFGYCLLCFFQMPRHFKSPIGTIDFLPDDYEYFAFIEEIIKKKFHKCGFRRISTPAFEELECFERSFGKATDIIQKELYTFEDKLGRTLALRPEVTTGIVRSFIEHKLYEDSLPLEVYYIENCFRFERVKSNTKRSFRQFGAEILGSTDPAIDAQIILTASQMLQKLKVSKLCELKVNNIGTPEDRQKYFEALENFYIGKERSLSAGTQEKLKQKNFIELLKPKTEDEEILAKMAPKMTDFLSPKSKEFFEETSTYLDILGVKYTIDTTLFRPFQYYAYTVFEFFEKNTNNKIMAGGRYDGLIEKMGGPNGCGGCGVSAGVERMIELMQRHKISLSHKNDIHVFVGATGPIGKKKALPLLTEIRNKGFNAIGNLGKTSIENLLKRAQKANAPLALLLGDHEVRTGTILVRNLETGKKQEIKMEETIPYLKKFFKERKEGEK